MEVRSACPHCGSSSFGWIERARFELVCDAKIDWGNVLNPEVSLLICEGCGYTAWFMREHKKMLAEIKHDRRVVDPTRYR